MLAQLFLLIIFTAANAQLSDQPGTIMKQTVHRFSLNATYRIVIITTERGAPLAVTNETVMAVFRNAMTAENRRNMSVKFYDGNLVTTFKSQYTAHLMVSNIRVDEAEQMYDAIMHRNETRKGRLLAVMDVARCVAAKCTEMMELMSRLPNHVAFFSSCCFETKTKRTLEDNENSQADSSSEDSAELDGAKEFETLRPQLIFTGLEPHTVVNFALQLAKMYNWRRFHFVVSPQWPVIDAFIDETFRYFKSLSSDVVLTKHFYCTAKLEYFNVCKQKNQIRRLILNKATCTFLLMESHVDMVEFSRLIRDEALADLSVSGGKAFIVLSLTGILAPTLADYIKNAPDGTMFLKKRDSEFTNFRTFVAYGIPNSDPASHIYSQVRVLTKAIDTFLENQDRFRKLSDLYCSTEYIFAESPNAIAKYSSDCQNDHVPVEIWNLLFDEDHNTHKNALDRNIFVKVFEQPNPQNLTVIERPHWLGSGHTPPVENECELEGGGSCPISIKLLLPSTIIGSTFIVALTTLLVFCIYKFEKRRQHRKQNAKDCVIARFSELEFMKAENEAFDHVTSAPGDVETTPSPALVQDAARNAAASRFSKRDSVAGLFPPSQRCQEMLRSGKVVGAKLRGVSQVFVSLLTQSAVEIDDHLVEELLQIKRLRHPNINEFFGITPDEDHVCVLYEYCAKGTLAQVLARKTLLLNRMFKVSFVNDIATGLAYLHQSNIHSHGQLTSDNVVVDARWFCKISNIPLPSLYRDKHRQEPAYYGSNNHRFNSFHLTGLTSTLQHAQLNQADLKARYDSLPPVGDFWTAPELLRIPPEMRPIKGTQKGDVFSFGVIVFEVATRSTPYASCTLPDKVILSRVRTGTYPPFRPKCLPDKWPEDAADLLELAQRCWDEISPFRPSFAKVQQIIEKMMKTKDVSSKLVDEMIATMESYAENLEATVQARTKELAEEQRRSDELLSKMLPRSIIDELKSGRVVHPETFDSVTVYFSDIVGFAKLAAESTALEIVDFLNDLYSEFDHVIDKYNVYKVETISDAYMVASGLPIRNKTHANEIATMALDIMSRVTIFKIRHRPDRFLQLRIGIHSGSVVAGIVGLKMPRYCLFGDTVNYASRMESSGLALRIHVSPEAKAKLDEIGGFKLEPRGFVNMKGKGSIQTYHLLGKEGFDKLLPDLKYAASLEEHEFK